MGRSEGGKVGRPGGEEIRRLGGEEARRLGGCEAGKIEGKKVGRPEGDKAGMIVIEGEHGKKVRRLRVLKLKQSDWQLSGCTFFDL